MLINGVNCDTYAYIDSNTVGETVLYDASERSTNNVVVYLFSNNAPHPVASSLTAQCCATNGSAKLTFNCTVGAGGQITCPIPSAFTSANNDLLCEIVVSGTDSGGVTFRYKSASFRVSIY